MSVEANSAIAAAAEAPRALDNAVPDAAAELKAELRTLHFNRRIYRQRLYRFTRTAKSVGDSLKKISQETTDEAKTATVKKAYQVLRNFCVAYNFVTLTKEEARNIIPTDF